jgi:hypothetical protein
MRVELIDLDLFLPLMGHDIDHSRSPARRQHSPIPAVRPRRSIGMVNVVACCAVPEPII